MTSASGWLLLILLLLVWPRLTLADGGETFFDARILAPGQTSVDDELMYSEDQSYADLYLGVFDEFNERTLTDNDSSYYGDGRAPAIFDAPINPNGDIDVVVTGASDVGFEGEHAEFGGYQAEVTIYDSEGDFLDGFLFDGFLAEGAVDAYFESDPSWVGGDYEVVVNNTIPNDIDFFRFNGLAAGVPFTAETAPDQFEPGFVDTYLGWFDESGKEIISDDDSGFELYSKVSGIVPPSGEVVLAVTGFGDYSFDGTHSQLGSYALLITLTGDYNFDAEISADDYDVWREEYGMTGDFLSADGNSDGVVDAADYAIWRNSLRVNAAPLAASAPEPGSSALLSALTSIALRLRFRL